jgi:uncharacterized membrane protein
MGILKNCGFRLQVGYRLVACCFWLMAGALLLPLAVGADGYELVGEKCQDCHTLKRVFKAHYDAAEWNEALGRMLEEGADFSDEERQQIIAFLVDQAEEKSWLQTVGTLHFVLNHFPIVLIWVVALFDGIALWRRERLAGAWVPLLLRLSVATMAAVILLGLALVDDFSTMSPMLLLHRNIGFVAGGLMLAAWVMRELALRRENERILWLYRGLLVLCLLATTVAADRGGALIHGDVVKRVMVDQAGD